MTTNNNNQPETNTPTFEENQSVWVRGRIATGVIHGDGDVGVIMQSADNKNSLYYCLVSGIRTTEQIVQEHGASAPQTASDGTIKLMLCLTEEEYKHLKCCVGSYEICGEYEEKLNESLFDKIRNGKFPVCALPPETPHFDEKTPHNAELTAQNAEPCDGDDCWIRAKFHEESEIGYYIVTPCTVETIPRTPIHPKHVRFSEPTHSTAIIELAEPDRNRRFKKGDKVRLVERWGRPLREGELFESWTFEPNKVYEVLKDEEDNEVELTNGKYSWDYPFYFLDLVEPAPEEQFFIDDELAYSSYQINYGTPNNHKFVAKLDTDYYTLEEARQECERLSKKERHE